MRSHRHTGHNVTTSQRQNGRRQKPCPVQMSQTHFAVRCFGLASFAQPGERRPRGARRPSRSLNEIGDGFQTGRRQFERVTWSSVIAAPDRRSRFRLDLTAKPSFASLALTLLKAAPLIVAGADKQRSLRCAAALIITSCASVSLTLMIQPFLSSWRSGRSGPLTRTSPGSASADGAVGSRARRGV